MNKSPVRNAILTFQSSFRDIKSMQIKCGGDKVKNSNNKYTAKARVKFSIEKKFSSFNHFAHIVIYNLNQNSIRYILQNFDSVILEAGYSDNLGVIFKGFINEIFYKKENDYILEIYAISNAPSKVDINISFGEDAKNIDVLDAVDRSLRQYKLTTINYSLADFKFKNAIFGNGSVFNYSITLDDLFYNFKLKSTINSYSYVYYYDDIKDVVFIFAEGSYSSESIILLRSEINEYSSRYWEAQNLLGSDYFNDIVYRQGSVFGARGDSLILSALKDANEKRQNLLNDLKITIKIDPRINIGSVLIYKSNNKEYIYQVIEIAIKGDTHIVSDNWVYILYLKKMLTQ
jgi:hypothetical protein